MGRKSTKNQPGILFGSIFFVVGLAAAYLVAGSMIFGYIESSGWVDVPAKIHHVSLIANSDEGSTTHTVKSSYSYEFEGVIYKNDRVSLSIGSDSFGQYWQELERRLLADQRGNEAFAIVNPDDPTEALLDRTLRWKSVLFGLTFLFAFSGVGIFIVWSALSRRAEKNGEMWLVNVHENGIPSMQKVEKWIGGGLGGIMFLMGLIGSVYVIPEALRNGEYGALLFLVFVIGGAGFMYHALKLILAYKRFGPTTLFLDPPQPGVGGQLGGRFNINASDIGNRTIRIPQLQAKLKCTHKRKSNRGASSSVLWQEAVPVYSKQTANGLESAFLFEIPDSCAPSGSTSPSTSITWKVSVEGEFSTSDLDKFARDWQIHIGDRATPASHDLNIPYSLINKQRTTIPRPG